MARDNYRYVHGNHDDIARDVLYAPTSMRVAEDDFPVFFIHGHQFDPMMQMPTFALSRAATWFTGRLRHVGMAPVAEFFEGKDVVIKHQRLGGLDGPYARAARRLLVEEQAACVVMGHTHIPVRYDFSEGISVNSGTCSRGQRCHVSIDTAARTVAIVRAPTDV